MRQNKSSHDPSLLEVLLTKFAFRFYSKSVYEDFANRLPIEESDNVLDFGCGMGTVAFYTAKKLTVGSLTCLDVSQKWLKECRALLRRYKNVIYMHSESDIPAFEGKMFDVVYCHFVLHDIDASSLEGVLKSLVLSIKNGGYLVFREPLSCKSKLQQIRLLAEQNGLLCKNSRVTDFPVMGNSLESYYIKTKGGLSID